MNIGELAQVIKVSKKSLRYYESIGLIPGVLRSENGYRVYTRLAVKRAKIITSLRSLGLSVKMIKKLVELQGGEQIRNQLQEVFEERRHNILFQISILQQQQNDLGVWSGNIFNEKITPRNFCLCALTDQNCDCYAIK